AVRAGLAARKPTVLARERTRALRQGDAAVDRAHGSPHAGTARMVTHASIAATRFDRASRVDAWTHRLDTLNLLRGRNSCPPGKCSASRTNFAFKVHHLFTSAHEAGFVAGRGHRRTTLGCAGSSSPAR